MSKNIERLQQLMTLYKLSKVEVSQLLHIKPRTVDSWFASENAKCFRRMPERQLLNLEEKLKMR